MVACYLCRLSNAESWQTPPPNVNFIQLQTQFYSAFPFCTLLYDGDSMSCCRFLKLWHIEISQFINERYALFSTNKLDVMLECFILYTCAPFLFSSFCSTWNNGNNKNGTKNKNCRKCFGKLKIHWALHQFNLTLRIMIQLKQVQWSDKDSNRWDTYVHIVRITALKRSVWR